MRILALDVGSKTIGVAVSDPMGWTAQGLTTLRRTGEQADFQAIQEWIKKLEATEILVGFPLNMDGSEGTQAIRMIGFADRLHQVVGLPVTLWDERLTTVTANEFLRNAEVSGRKRRKVIDKMAAVFILQGYLDSRRGE